MRAFERLLRVSGLAVGCVLIGAIGLWELPARADDAPKGAVTDEARSHYEQGQRAFVGRRFVEAAIHFEAAGERSPHASSWYMAAEAWDRAARLEKTADALSRALGAPGLTDELRDKMKRRLDQLEQALGTILVEGLPTYRASLDGSVSITPPASIHVLPGAHVLMITPPDKASIRKELVLGAGDRKTIAIDAEQDDGAKTEVAPPPPAIRYVDRFVDRPVPRRTEPRKYVGFGLLGLGVASAAGALAFGANALDARDAYRMSPTQDGYDHVRSLQTTTNVAWTLAAASILSGAVLLFWPSGSEK